MAQKPEFQTFTQNWNRTVQWAQQNKIPYNAYYPVYQMDAQRQLSGTPMSESERIRAIEAAAHLNYSTALPTDNPSWTDIRGNAVRNAQSIFTGLEPTHIIPNVVDTFKNAIEHPSDIFGAIGDLFSGNLPAASRQILKPDNILTWIPGVYDLATVYSGGMTNAAVEAGEKKLAKDPISSILDVLPFGRIASEALGRTALGASVADHIGLSDAELRKVGIWRVGGKLIKGAPAGGLLKAVRHPFIEGHVDPATGLKTPTGIDQHITMGDMWEYYKAKVGAGSEDADVTMARIQANRKGTELVAKYLKPAFTLFSKLTPEQRNFLTQWSKVDFRPIAEKMRDGRIDPEVRNAYKAAWDWGQKFKEMAMQAGEAINVKSPFKDPNGNDIFETYWVDTNAYRSVQSALDKAEAAQKDVLKARGPFMDMLAQMDENDRNMQGIFEALKNQQQIVYDGVRRTLAYFAPSDKEHARLSQIQPLGKERFTNQIPDDAQLLHNLLGLLPGDKINLHQINAVRDLFAPGGLLEQMYFAYKDQDWVKLNKVTKAAVRKFKSKALQDVPRAGRATLFKVSQIAENLQRYAAERQKQAEELNKMATGYYRGKKMGKAGYRKSLSYLTVRADDLQKDWIKAAIQHPPDVWRNAAMDGITKRLAQSEKTAASMDAAATSLSEQGWENSEVTRLRRNDRNLIELMVNANKSSMENAMLSDIDHEEYNRSVKSEYDYIASLRARGHQPLYVPSVSPHDVATGEATYDVYLRGITARRPSAGYEKVWGYTPSIYNIQFGMLKATKELVERDMMRHFVDQELMPRLMPAKEVQDLVRSYYKSEIDALNIAGEEGLPAQEHASVVIERGVQKLGLVTYTPELVGLGKGFGPATLKGEYYMDERLAKTFNQTISTFQFPAQKLIDRGTQVFRFSILGLSPRYTAHILFGGTFLVALRGHPSMLKYVGNAAYFALHHSFSEATQQRFPTLDLETAARELGGESTQEGAASIQYHYAMANSAGRNWLIPEKLAKLGLPDNMRNRIKAAAELNMSFTRAITRMQKAVVYLDGAARAGKEGSFYADEWVPRQPVSVRSFTTEMKYDRNALSPDDLATINNIEGEISKVIDSKSQSASAVQRLQELRKQQADFQDAHKVSKQTPTEDPGYHDAQGRPTVHPITGHRIHDRVREEHPMTGMQAHNEGMKAVAEVMGELRHMTPLERNMLIRIFPFYGWTKHILQYVLSYPFDHPWRAMILSNLALMDVQDQASGLPIRLQLLTFLGQPDQMGNVTALDTKSLNPLRDTANYASLTGLFESLNPAITGVGALVDPQISFAGQNAYPQISYNQLYGISTAGAGGNIWNAAEQFVPQLQALDSAFNLSGQYAYLKNASPGQFSKKVFESLGLPLMPQQMNLRQMAAKAEIDRYKQSAAAAYQVATTGDLSAIKGYAPNALLPDPLNTEYNVTPEYLAALTQESEKQTGLPFYETQRPPPNPPL